MSKNKTIHGTGDKNFTGITIHKDDNEQPLAVEIPNPNTSGSTFYQPDENLVSAVESLPDRQQGTAPTFAKLMGHPFYAADTSAENANNAVLAVQRQLSDRGLELASHSELVEMLSTNKDFNHTPQTNHHTLEM